MSINFFNIWNFDTYRNLFTNDKIVIKPYNVVDHTDLPEMSLDQIPTGGDQLEIKSRKMSFHKKL